MLFFFASCIHIYVIVMFGRCSVVSFQFFIVSDRLISFRWWEEVNSFYIDLIIYISEANWHLFDAQFLAIVLLAREGPMNEIPFYYGREEKKRKTEKIHLFSTGQLNLSQFSCWLALVVSFRLLLQSSSIKTRKYHKCYIFADIFIEQIYQYSRVVFHHIDKRI